MHWDLRPENSRCSRVWRRLSKRRSIASSCTSISAMAVLKMHPYDPLLRNGVCRSLAVLFIQLKMEVKE